MRSRCLPLRAEVDREPMIKDTIGSLLTLSEPVSAFSHLLEFTFSMDSAAAFLQVWGLFDPNDHGYIDGNHGDEFFRHIVKKLEITDQLIEDRLQRLRDASAEGRLHIRQVASIFLPEDENFLLLFRRETPLDNSVEFMRIWRRYDADSSGFISAVELKSFLEDLFEQHNKSITPDKLELYTNTIMKMFDKNQDGHLDLNDMARILSLKENFLLKFEMDACSQKDRARDFEKIFAHYDVSKTGALEGPEVDGFVKDMMELVKPNLSGADLDRFKQALLSHCDVNRDGKIQKNELALCLGLKLAP